MKTRRSSDVAVADNRSDKGSVQSLLKTGQHTVETEALGP